MGKWVKALYDILLDRTEPAEMLEMSMRES